MLLIFCIYRAAKVVEVVVGVHIDIGCGQSSTQVVDVIGVKGARPRVNA